MNIIDKLCVYKYFDREEGSSCLGHSTKAFQNGNGLTYTQPQPDSETDKDIRLNNIQDPNRNFPFAMEGNYCDHRIYLWIDGVPELSHVFFLDSDINLAKESHGKWARHSLCPLNQTRMKQCSYPSTSTGDKLSCSGVLIIPLLDRFDLP